MAAFSVLKKIHWSDADPAGIAWFPNFFGWFENAEEELFAAALGRSRQDVLGAHDVGIPRVAAHIDYVAPVRVGTLLRVAIEVTVENPRRLRYQFEMYDTSDQRRVAHGYVRVACVTLSTFAARDFPDEVRRFVDRVQILAVEQSAAGATLPWA